MKEKNEIVPEKNKGRETEEELLASRHFYRTLIDKALDCVAVVDEKGVFKFLSSSVEKVLGYRTDELIGKNAFDFFHPEELGNLTAVFINSIKQPGKVELFEQRFRHKDGSWRILEVMGTTLFHNPVVNGALINFRDITRRREAEKKIKRINQALELETEQRKIISRRLTELMEQDRRSVAMDLHDHIGQILTTLKMELAGVLKKLDDSQYSAASGLKIADQKINQIMDSLRNIAQGLHPSELDNLGLVSSLRSLCLQIQESTGTSVKFYTKDMDGRFAKEKELALYRVAQESLNNVIKHAQARNIHVSLTKRNRLLSLTVEDDGKGFDLEKNHNNQHDSTLGLLYMKERLFQVQGDLRIESGPGSGTIVWAEIRI